MNILIVSHGIPSEEDPQWGCFEMDQATALAERGHSISIAAIDGRFRRQYRKIGITDGYFGKIKTFLYYLIPQKAFVFPWLKRKFRVLMMTRLIEYIVREQGVPDVIFAHYLFNIGDLCQIKTRYPSLPIVGMEHWSELLREELLPHVKSLGKVAYHTTDKLLVVSSELRDRIKYLFNVDADVVHDMVDKVFLETPILKRRADPFTFVSCGSLIPRKGYDVLIRAFAKLQDREARLIIIGDGELRAELSALCRDFSVIDRVSFTGKTDRNAIARMMSDSSAYVLASRSETVGVSYIEALAMGLPVIATRCGGPEAFMTEKCGLMVDVDDVEGLTAAMDRLEKGIDSYSPGEIRDYIRSHFSGEVIAKQLEKIFEEEIKAKK